MVKNKENFKSMNCVGCQCDNCYECASCNCDICYRAEFATEDCDDMYFEADSKIDEDCDVNIS